MQKIRRLSSSVSAALLLVLVLGTSAGLAAASGPSTQTLDVYSVQQRLIDLGYLNYRATGNYGDITEEAVRSFQRANNLPADGMVGSDTLRLLYSDDAARAPANTSFKSAVGRSYTGSVRAEAELGSWEKISQEFPVGSAVTVTDYNTGEQFRMRRTGGTNNAEVVAESVKDNETFEYIFGGTSWEHRSVLVRIGDTTYAASLFGMPTRLDSKTDGSMSGSTFMYFNNSSADVLGLSDEEHAVSITAIAG